MKPPKKIPRIKDLTGPRRIQGLYTNRLRLTKGTIIQSILEETGFGAKFLFLRFVRESAPGTATGKKDILFEDNIPLSSLPLATISSRTMAHAAQDPRHGQNLQGLGMLFFCSVIDSCAKVRLTSGVNVITKQKLVRLSIKINKFSTAAICSLDDLAGFVELYDDRDEEVDGEEQ